MRNAPPRKGVEAGFRDRHDEAGLDLLEEISGRIVRLINNIHGCLSLCVRFRGAIVLVITLVT